jgi:voltage-gated potassium channel
MIERRRRFRIRDRQALEHHTVTRARLFRLLWLILGVNTVGVLGYHFIEGWSFIDALFMTVITETTTGYGEVHPLSQAGRAFTIALLLVSVGIIGYAVSTLVTLILEGDLNRIIQGQRMDSRITRLKQHIVLCGLGRTGRYIAEELIKTRTPFVVIDRNHAHLHELDSVGEFLHVEGDATHDETLLAAGVDRARGVVVSLDDDRSNVFVVLSARSLNPKARIVSRVLDEENSEKLLKAGADEVISPNAIGGMRMASAMIRPAVVGFLDQMLRTTDQVVRVEEVRVDLHPDLVGKTLASANLEERAGVLILAIKGRDHLYQFNPSRNTVLKRGDVVIVMGPREHLARLSAAEEAAARAVGEDGDDAD